MKKKARLLVEDSIIMRPCVKQAMHATRISRTVPCPALPCPLTTLVEHCTLHLLLILRGSTQSKENVAERATKNVHVIYATTSC